MEDRKSIVGLILIGIGIIFLVDQLGISAFLGFTPGQLISLLWPLVLVAFGISFLSKRNTVLGLVFVGLGAVFLLSDLLNVNVWGMIWPLALVFVGISMLTKGSIMPSNSISGETEGDEIFESVNFAELKRVVTSSNFKGGRINCSFAGAEIDLRNAKIDPEGAHIEINCSFAGVEILVPEDVRVESAGSPFLGSWENSFKSSSDEKAPLLRLTGSVSFGGVEVRN